MQKKRKNQRLTITRLLQMSSTEGLCQVSEEDCVTLDYDPVMNKKSAKMTTITKDFNRPETFFTNPLNHLGDFPCKMKKKKDAIIKIT